MADEDYRIAAGYDVGLGSLVRIYSIDPGDGDYFDPPKGIALYDDGQVVTPLDGLTDTEGFAAVTWLFTRMSYVQLYYIRTTYCGGGLSGKVTIYTPIKGNSSFTRKNAILTIKKGKDIRSEYRFQDVELVFTRLADPS